VVTGKDWRLPTNAEWEAAVGTSSYPWGDYFPPKWDDGNYAILADGKADPKQVGVDGILGTAPVGSFKPNALGFYDLGGNAYECTSDGQVKQAGRRIVRGAGWDSAGELRVSWLRDINPVNSHIDYGFRLARGRLQSGEGASR
jgi:formylglycine-generating enzyme required for sulfatase activity